MRVVIAVHGTHRYSGVPKYSYLLARELARNGVGVTVIVDSETGRKRVLDVCEGLPVEAVVVLPTVENAVTTAKHSWNLSEFLLEHSDFNILQASHVTPFCYLMSWEHKPVVFHPFGNELFSLSGYGMSRAYCAIARPILRFCGHNADRLLMEDEIQRDDMTKWYNNANRMRVLPVGIDVSEIPVKGNYERKDKFHFLTVNSLYPYEGLESLIASFGVAYSAIATPDIQLTIVGSGPLEAKLKSMAVGLPVSFVKEISDDELGRLRTDADCYISTTEETDFQMGVLEAMAAGLPIIGTGRGWLPNGAIGSTKAALSNVIIRMVMTDNGYRENLGSKMVSLSSQFDFPNIARQAISIYEELL